MKKIVKLSILLLVLSAMMPGLSRVVSAEEEKSYSEAMRVMSVIKVVDNTKEGFNPNANITRGEFTGVIAKLIGIGTLTGSGTRYIDVTADTENAGFIEALADRGIVSGYEDRRFYPDEPVFYEEAVKIIVSCLGYDYMAEQVGGFPYGYISYAKTLGITKDVSVSTGDTMTWAMTAQLALNAANVDIWEAASYGESYSYKKTDTIFSRYHKILKIRGKITASAYTSVTGIEGAGKGSIILGADKYSYSGDDSGEFLGHDVIAYVQNEETVIYISSQLQADQRIEISSDKIDNKTTMDRIVYEKGDKEYKENIKNAAVIYNGKFTDEYTNADFKPDSGKLELIDADGNGIYELVKITSYITKVVEKASNDSILIKDTNEVITRDMLETADFVTIGKLNSLKFIAEYDLSDLSEYTILLFASSKDGKYINILVSDESDVGTLNSLSESEISIGDNTYQMSEYLKALIQSGAVSVSAGNSYTLYLDAFGKAAAIEPQAGKTLYGYLMKVAMESELSSKPIFRLLIPAGSEGEIKNFLGAENVKINSTVLQGNINKNTYLVKDGQIIKQLVKYTTNAAGEITCIETAKNKIDKTIDGQPNPDYDSNYDHTGNEFTLDARLGNMAYRGYSCCTLEATEFKINSKCKAVFVIYEGTDVDEKEQRALTSYSAIYKPETYPYGTTNCYDVTKDYETSVIVLTKAAGSGPVAGVETMGYDEASYLVEKVIGQANYDGDPSYAVVTGGQKIVAKDPELKDVAGRWYSSYKGIMFKDIKPGSVVQISKDNHGEAIEMRIMYSPGIEPEFREMHNDGTGAVSEDWDYATTYTAHGKVIRATKSGDLIYNANGFWANLADRPRAYDRNLTASVPPVLFDMKTGKVKEISVNDILPGDELFIRRSNGHWVTQVIIYK